MPFRPSLTSQSMPSPLICSNAQISTRSKQLIYYPSDYFNAVETIFGSWVRKEVEHA